MMPLPLWTVRQRLEPATARAGTNAVPLKPDERQHLRYADAIREWWFEISLDIERAYPTPALCLMEAIDAPLWPKPFGACRLCGETVALDTDRLCWQCYLDVYGEAEP